VSDLSAVSDSERAACPTVLYESTRRIHVWDSRRVHSTTGCLSRSLISNFGFCASCCYVCYGVNHLACVVTIKVEYTHTRGVDAACAADQRGWTGPAL
jgi:hypothetical protein